LLGTTSYNHFSLPSKSSAGCSPVCLLLLHGNLIAVHQTKHKLAVVTKKLQTAVSYNLG